MEDVKAAGKKFNLWLTEEEIEVFDATNVKLLSAPSQSASSAGSADNASKEASAEPPPTRQRVALAAMFPLRGSTDGAIPSC